MVSESYQGHPMAPQIPQTTPQPQEVIDPFAEFDTLEILHNMHREEPEEPKDDGSTPVVRFLSREDILSAADIQEADVPVPEWGGPGATVRVRGMTGKQRDRFEESIMEGKGRNRKANFENFRAKLVARSIIDPTTGRPLLRPSDVEPLGNKSAAALQRVFNKIQELNGISDEDQENLTGDSKPVRS